MPNDVIEELLKELLTNQNSMSVKLEGVLFEQKHIKENMIEIKTQNERQCLKHDESIKKDISNAVVNLEFNFEKRITRLMWWFISSVVVSVFVIFVDGFFK
jgi:hypothetical protein